MIGKKVTLYFYENGAQLNTGFFNFLMDTALVEKYAVGPVATWTTLQNWSGVNFTNLAVPVNQYLGVPLLTKSNTLYSALRPGYSYPASFNNARNALGLYCAVQNQAVADEDIYFQAIGGSQYASAMPRSTYDSQSPFDLLNIYAAVPLYTMYVTPSHFYEINIRVIREDAFNADGDLVNLQGLDFRITGYLANDHSSVTSAKLEVSHSNSGIGTWYPAFNSKTAQAQDADINNPFDDDDNNGGDGDNYPPEVDPTDVPGLPGVGSAELGLISLYNPTKVQLQSLASFLWSGPFDPDTFKKVFTDPMDCIIGLGILPAIPSTAGSKNIKFGNVDSGVNSAYFSTSYCTVNCGSVKIRKDIGSFLDYDSKLSIYLPYIGFRELSPDDVMGASLQVVYNIDILTGACAAFIKHSSRGVMYAYNGSCITNVALSGANYASAIQNAVSTVASGVGVLAGMASGAAPVTLMSGVSMLTSAANTALNSKPSIQRSGNLGGSAGILSVQKPFIVVQRPNYSVPSYAASYGGRVCNKTMSLGGCKGFTMVDQCHLDGISATPGEISEIETMLKAGVIL